MSWWAQYLSLGQFQTGTQAFMSSYHPHFTCSIGHCCLWAHDDSVVYYEPARSVAPQIVTKYAK